MRTYTAAATWLNGLDMVPEFLRKPRAFLAFFDYPLKISYLSYRHLSNWLVQCEVFPQFLRRPCRSLGFLDIALEDYFFIPHTDLIQFWKEQLQAELVSQKRSTSERKRERMRAQVQEKRKKRAAKVVPTEGSTEKISNDKITTTGTLVNIQEDFLMIDGEIFQVNGRTLFIGETKKGCKVELIYSNGSEGRSYALTVKRISDSEDA